MSSSNNLIYKGPNLPCTGIDTWDDATVALQKLDNVSCQLTNQMYNIQQQINSYVNPPTSTTTSSTSSTTTAPGRVFIQNSSIDVTIYGLWMTDGLGNFYNAIYYSGSNLPLGPGQSGYFTVPGSNGAAIYMQINYSANSGGATFISVCGNTSSGPAPLINIGGITSVGSNCGLPILPGTTYTITINQ